MNGKYNCTSEKEDTVVSCLKRKVAFNTHEATYQLYLALPGLICNTGPVWGTILQEIKHHMRVKGSRDRPGTVQEMPFLGWVVSIMAEGDDGTAALAAQPVTARGARSP